MSAVKKVFSVRPTYGHHRDRRARPPGRRLRASSRWATPSCSSPPSPPRRRRPGKDFFPLTVNYIEKTYAAGRIPGGFFKREGRPTEKETLTSRLIDRPIRPLFPDGFYNEVQVVATVLSLDPDIDADIPALIGASAALVAGGRAVQRPDRRRARRLQGRPVPAEPDRARSSPSRSCDLVVAGTAKAVLMVESEAKGLSEEVMLGAVVFGHEQMQVAIKAINELVAAAGKPRWNWKPTAANAELDAAPSPLHAQAALSEAYLITDKQDASRARSARSRPQTASLALAGGDAPKCTDDAGRQRALQAREQHRPPAHPERRAAHRRPRSRRPFARSP